MQNVQLPTVTFFGLESCIDNDGKVFEDGSNFAPNVSEPCWMCNCVEGSVKYCAMQMCDEPQCSNYRLIEGTCCGFVCLEDDQPGEIISQFNGKYIYTYIILILIHKLFLCFIHFICV